MNTETQEAVKELRAAFGARKVITKEEPVGVLVTIIGIDFGGKFAPGEHRLSFLIPDSYPWADVYPLYVIPPLERTDGQGMPNYIQFQSWMGESASQISIRSRKASEGRTISAVAKVKSVLDTVKKLGPL